MILVRIDQSYTVSYIPRASIELARRQKYSQSQKVGGVKYFTAGVNFPEVTRAPHVHFREETWDCTSREPRSGTQFTLYSIAIRKRIELLMHFLSRGQWHDKLRSGL